MSERDEEALDRWAYRVTASLRLPETDDPNELIGMGLAKALYMVLGDRPIDERHKILEETQDAMAGRPSPISVKPVMDDTRVEIRRDEEIILSMTFEEVIAYAKGARPSN